MKILKYTAAALLLSSTLLACKKGENDPFLSLKSRAARLDGEWILESIDSKREEVNTNGSIKTINETYLLDDLTLTTNTINGSSNTTTKTIYREKITFEKKGTFTRLSEYIDNSKTIELKGNWLFLEKSEEFDLKSKEAIMLSKTEQTTTNSSNNTSSKVTTSEIGGEIWTFKQLSSKEIIIEISSDNSDSNGKKTTFFSTLVYKKS